MAPREFKKMSPRKVGAAVLAAALTAALGLIAVVPTASASIADYYAEGVPVPSWFTDTTTKLGCTLPDDPQDVGFVSKRLTCGHDWTHAGCYAEMSQLSSSGDHPLGELSPGGYAYATFDCAAALPNTSPPDQCYGRFSEFVYSEAVWQPFGDYNELTDGRATDTGWVRRPGYIGCVYAPGSRAAAIKKCKKKNSAKARKKCIKKAKKLARSGALG